VRLLLRLLLYWPGLAVLVLGVVWLVRGSVGWVAVLSCVLATLVVALLLVRGDERRRTRR
jgi:membrane protein implicated in regulation of membrane protease activity